ncbi:MAG: hypothetical protein JWN48_99 [Myxococcaceae bacterium]|nr:hypothetical protein [Myxococcaceae bacterium]
MNEQTRALYEAHVAHELSAALEREQNDYFERLTAELFSWLATVKLDDLLTREQVLGVIDRYVIELRISGGIAELVGQMSLIIFRSDASAETRIDQLLSYESYRGFADKIQSLDAAFGELIQLLTRARSFQPLLARTVVLAARAVLFERGKGALPEHAGLLAQLLRDLKAELAQRLEAQLDRYLEQHVVELASASEARLRELIDPESVRSLADDLWDAVSGMRLSELFSLLSSTDLEDFVVLAYECWLSFRHTAYFRTVCTQVVDAVFGKFGGESVQSVLDDLGVDELMVAHELRALVAPMFAQAAQTGFLEQQIRARLEPFYRSTAARALLEPAPAVP